MREWSSTTSVYAAAALPLARIPRRSQGSLCLDSSNGPGKTGRASEDEDDCLIASRFLRHLGALPFFCPLASSNVFLCRSFRRQPPMMTTNERARDSLPPASLAVGKWMRGALFSYRP